MLKGFAVDLSPATAEALQNDRDVRRVVPDGASRSARRERPPGPPPELWRDRDCRGAGTTIAVIDTGVDYLHPDLGGCFGAGCKVVGGCDFVIGGCDFVNGDGDPLDDQGHGTYVAHDLRKQGAGGSRP